MKTMKRVFAAMITTGLLAVSILNTEAAEIGTFKTAGAGMIANGSPAVAGPLAAGTSKATPAKKTESGSSAAKEKANTQKSTSETTKKTTTASDAKSKVKTAAKTAATTKKTTATSAAKKAATKTSAEKASSAKKAAEKSSTAKTTAAKNDTAKTSAAKKNSAKASTAKKTTTQKATTQKATTQKAATAKTAAAKTPTIDQAKTSALNALSYRLTSPRTTVYVYRDYGLTQNHFTQRKKIFGSDESLVKTMDENCTKKPYSGTTCIRCEQSASKKDRGGWMFLNGYLREWDGTPGTNDGKKGGAGMDLTGADALRFYAKGKKGGETVEFFTCGFGYDVKGKKTAENPDSSVRKSLGQVKLTKDWKEYVIPLKGVNLKYIVCGFGYAVDGWANSKKDTVFYLDEIRFTGKIKSAQTAPVLLRSSDENDERLRNAAYTEDNALAALAFLSAGKKNEAKQILDAFVYAVKNDRAYASANSKDSPRRVRNAYAAGDIRPLPGWNTGTRLSGWYDKDTGNWMEDLKQVGSSTASNSYAALALLQYYNTYGGKTYLETARSLMEWVLKNCFDHSLGFTEGFDGWKESDKLEDHTLTNRPTKDNLLAYAAFSRLYDATKDEKYLDAGLNACRFSENMYNEWKGRFMPGTLEDGYTPDTRSFVYLEIQTLGALTMWDTFNGPYLRTLTTIEDMKVKDGGYPYNRNNKNGGWWTEGTASTALMYRVLGKNDRYKAAMNALVKVQHKSGLFPAATVDNHYTGLTQTDGTSLMYTKDAHIAPTAWFIMAENGYNPFAPHKAKGK